jgi:hypothetical protein
VASVISPGKRTAEIVTGWGSASFARRKVADGRLRSLPARPIVERRVGVVTSGSIRADDAPLATKTTGRSGEREA